ncbi:MAG: translocation/assembly module TamB domain-containing protein, partial [Luteimonas sp.]
RLLRERRRVLARRWAIRSAIGTVALVVGLTVIAYWLLMTLGGRGFLLSQVSARLPAGTSLTWQHAEGPASGPLTLTGLRFTMQRCPDKDGEPVAFDQCATPGTLRFAARRVTIDPDIRPLLGRLLRVDALDIEGATLDLPKSDEPFALPRWPDVLPRIELPIGLQADAIRVDDFKVTTASEPTIDIRSLRGGLDARDGKLHLQRIVIDSDRGRFTAHGDYVPRNNYTTDLTLGALLPAPLGRARPRIGLVARGTLDAMAVAIAGNVPKPLHAAITLHGTDTPRWTLKADSAALDAGLLAGLAPSTPLTFDITASGVGGEANLRGKLTQGDLRVVLQPSVLKLDNQAIELKPLLIDTLGGRISARGKGDFNDPRNARFKLAVVARDLAFGASPAANGQPATPPVTAIARLGIAGTSADWAVIGNATLARDGQTATVTIDGRGDTQKVMLKTAHIAMPTGTLDASGVVNWAPALGWDISATLAGFDPGYFAADFRGAVKARIASIGSTRADGGLELQADIDQLGGTLRARKLGGRARFAMHGAATGETTPSDHEGEIALSLGDSRIDARGRISDTLAIDANLAPLQLADLLPGTTGTLRGTLKLGGARNAPDLQADLTFSA